MSILQRVVHDVKAGWAALRYGTAQAATRALEEAELLGLRAEARRLDERLNDLLGDIGERAVELYERGEAADRIFVDHDILRRVEQVSALKAERARVTSEMDDTRPNS